MGGRRVVGLGTVEPAQLELLSVERRDVDLHVMGGRRVVGQILREVASLAAPVAKESLATIDPPPGLLLRPSAQPPSPPPGLFSAQPLTPPPGLFRSTSQSLPSACRRVASPGSSSA